MSPARLLLPLLLLLAAPGCEGDEGLRDVQVHLTATPAALDFGPVPVGRARTLEVAVRASSATRATLQWRTSGEAFSLREAPPALAGALARAQLAWQPQAEGPVEGWLEVGLAGAPAEQWLRLPLRGEGRPADSCRAGGTCEQALWDEAAGTCTRGPAPDGTACASACLSDAVCVSGECRGSRPACDDGNACTQDTCVEGEGCTHAEVACPSPSPCQVGVCDAQAGCTQVPAPDGTPCGPQQGCSSAEVCLSGTCSTVDPPDGVSCALEGAHPCVRGACVGSSCQAVQREVTEAGASCPAHWERCPGGSFLPLPGSRLPAGLGAPVSLALGDVNGDGWQDAVVGLSSSRLTVLLGLGDGRFTGPVPQPAEVLGQLVAVGDFDTDGRAELLVLEEPGASALRLWRAGAEGRLEAVQHLVLAARAGRPVLGDVDGNGHTDVAVPLPEVGAVELWLGQPGAGFLSVGVLPLGEMPPDIALGDVDGDGRLDLAAILPSADGVGVWRGAADGTFAPLGTHTLHSFDQPQRLVLADLDGNGRAELVVAASGSIASTGGRLEVAELGPAGTFVTRLNPETGNAPFVWVADLTADGLPDVLMRHWMGHQLLLHHDAQAGQYLFDTLQLDGPLPLTAAGDVEGDGLLDVVAVEASTGSLTVYRNAGGGRLERGWSESSGTARELQLFGAGDLDGDGDTDVVGCGAAGSLQVHASQAPRTFQAARTEFLGFSCQAALAAVLPARAGEKARLVLADAQGQALHWLFLRFGSVVKEGSLPLPEVPSRLAAGDLDGDGRVDLLLLDETGTRARAWLQQGATLGFTAGPQSTFDTPVGTWQLVELDGDGREDLLLGLQGSGGAEVRLGLGDGAFSGPLSHALPARAGTALVADFTADGEGDLLFCPLTPGGTGLEVWRAEGGGRFVPLSTVPLAGTAPLVPTLADVDGDGRGDLLAHGAEGQLSVLRGLGGTRFSREERAWVGGGGVLVRDLDGDGRLDVAASDYGEAGLLRVHWNACGP